MDKQQQQQEVKPGEIHFGSYEYHVGYVTGVARVTSPTSAGVFEVRVSGPQGSINQFAAEARFTQLDITPVDNAKSAAAMLEAEALAARREAWYSRLDALKKFIGGASLSELADVEGICHTYCMEGKRAVQLSSTPDLTRNRLIQVSPLWEKEPQGAYLLAFTLHPNVAQGMEDIYQPQVKNKAAARASLTVIGGDPDLYLFRGGQIMDVSNSTCNTEAVFSQDGQGDWELHVYGYIASSYVLSGSWLQT